MSTVSAPVVTTDMGSLPPQPNVVSIGAFDGVHRGHAHILGIARELARANSSRLVVVTFEPLPGEVFAPDVFPGRITSRDARRALLIDQGADAIVELPFSRAFAQTTVGEFVEHMRSMGTIRAIVVGQDFALGKGRAGSPDVLRDLLRDDGTEVLAVPRISVDGREVSSTAIRRQLIEGRVEDAAVLLGRPFSVSGHVVEGAKLGRQIGFPTANVAPPEEQVSIADGIYASLTRIGDDPARLPAMTYIGTRPAVNTGKRMIETHLFDFDADLYGLCLTTDLVRHLRNDADFPSLEDLIRQLNEDERDARAFLAADLGSVENR